jgi:probable F420-dependent oxidoreductase
MVKIGLTLPTYRRLADRAAITAVADKAELYAFHSLWCVDHVIMAESHLDHFGPTFFEAPTTLAYLAGRTSRVMLGCSIMPIAYRHPLLQAKMIATLDQLSGGRAIYGGAAGYLEGEFAALGIDFHQRGQIADEYLQAIRIAWTEERPEFHGRFVDFARVRTDPKPVQQPHPTIWVGGDSDAAFRRVARFGDGWHAVMSSGPTLDILAGRLARLHDIARRDGRDPASIRLSLKADGVILATGSTPPDRAFVGDVRKLRDDVLRTAEMGFELVVLSPTVTKDRESLDAVDLLGAELLPNLR